MYRTNTCGELRITDAGREVTLAGWVQRVRKMGGMTFLDIRDRYGITQVVFNNESDSALCDEANRLGREFVVQVKGTVAERSSKNPNLPTGDIEIIASSLTVLNPSEVPPFTIEDETDGGDDIRMKYRYLDLRRNPVRRNLELRHRMTMETPPLPRLERIPRNRDTDAGRFHSRRSTRLRCAFAHEPRMLLRPPAITPDAQTAADGVGHGPLLPDCEMLPRRRPSRRPSARVHPD